jgi:hypothetical protein
LPGHGQTVCQKIRDAANEHDLRRQPAACDSGDHGERRDETVIRAVHDLAHVVARDLKRPMRLHVVRCPDHACAV